MRHGSCSELQLPRRIPAVAELWRWAKMKFSHTYAFHSCFKCKGFSHKSGGSPNWSWYYLILAIGAAIPLWLFSMFSPLKLPWYHFFGILASEIILFYGVGLITGLVLIFRNIRPTKCPKCHSALGLAGSYFDSNENMNFDDWVFSVIFIGINIGAWIFIFI
jgi:hypothetical protein